MEKVFTKATKLLPFMGEDRFPLVLLISLRNIVFEREQTGTRFQGEVIQKRATGKEDETRLLFILKEPKVSIMIRARYYSIGSDKTFLQKADEMAEPWAQ